LKNTYDFLLPFTCVLSLYLVLVAVVAVAVTLGSTSLQFLVTLENALATIKSYSYFKLSPVQVLLCYIALYLLGVFPLFLAKRKRIYDWFEKYYLPWTKRIYIALVLLCSFTLLGTQVGPPETDLRVRINTIRSDYANLQRHSQEVLAQEVALQIYKKEQDSLPPSYRKALVIPEQIHQQVNSLRDFYTKAQREYGIKTDKAENILRLSAQRNEKVSTLETEFRLPDETIRPNEYLTEPDPSQISSQKIKEAETALENFKQNRPASAITFFTSQEGKKIVLQTEKILSSSLRKEMFAAVVKTWPYSGVIIDVFIDTFDDKVKASVEKLIDKVTNYLVRNPENASKVISEEATAIVNQVEIKLPPETVKKADQSGKQLEQELADITAAKLEVDNGIKETKNAEVDKLIAQLQSPTESTRETAAANLSRMGDQLSQSKVNELVDIMRHGSKTWTDSYREEGHHCTWYESTPIRYYASKALADMKSPYVKDDVAREARRCQGDCVTRKKVTDPGWI
jgi:hypothetical protein